MTQDIKDVLKLALEALEELFDTNGYWWQEVDEQTLKKIEHSITAIKEALREHAMREVQRLGQEIEQEPVVGITAIRTWFKDGRVVTQTLCNSWVDTTPPQRTEQEPVAWINVEERKLEWAKPMSWNTPTTVNIPKIPLYTTPPQSKPLTDEQIEDAWRKVETGDFYDCVQPFARAIEAAHGIKENK